MNPALVINITEGQLPGHGSFVRLEQILPPEMSEYASLADLHRMWLEAATGKSAHLLRSSTCPVEFDGEHISIHLGFYAWPSDPDMSFGLLAALGEIGAGRKIEKPREYSAFLAGQDQLALDYYMQDVEVAWETPVYGEDGGQLAIPSFRVTAGVSLVFPHRVTGSIRIKGTAVGFHHVIKTTISKSVAEEELAAGENPYPTLDKDTHVLKLAPVTRLNAPAISSLENTITAAWLDGEETRTAQLDLKLPKCAEAVLSMCPDMYQTTVLLCSESSTLQVYYNACTGKVITAVSGLDPQRFCTDITGLDSYMAPWGVI